jgi:hypothetical protein
MSESLVKILTLLTQSCWNWSYYFVIFKIACTVVLKKSNKNKYDILKMWRSIALFNIFKKIVKAAIVWFIQNIAKKHNFLLKQQIKACRNRSTETVINLLLSQICIMWNLNNFVASILLLNISEAFDKVVKKELIHILQQKDISFSIINWINSFMINRSITLLFKRKKFKIFEI